MDVGLMMISASHNWAGMNDRQVWDEDIRLAEQAPALGTTAAFAEPVPQERLAGAQAIDPIGRCQRSTVE